MSTLNRIGRVVLTLCLVAATVALPACNTARGVGKDAEAIGDRVQGEELPPRD